MGIRSLNRWQASGGHFLFSACLGIGIFLLFRFLWYPEALWELAGAGKLMLIILGVDVALGPLLTLLVFNPKKRELLFDLGVIVALQVAALAYGLNVMAQSRPVFLVAAADRIVLVSANELSAEAISAAAKPEYQRLSWTGPRLVGAESNLSGQARLDQILEAVESGVDIERLPRFYLEFQAITDKLYARALALDELANRNSKKHAAILAYVNEHQLDPGRLLLLPLQARTGFGSVLIDRSEHRIVGTTTVDLFD